MMCFLFVRNLLQDEFGLNQEQRNDRAFQTCVNRVHENLRPVYTCVKRVHENGHSVKHVNNDQDETCV